MAVQATVWRSFYQDSVVLMRLAAEIRALPGVREAAALMGTPANHELLASAGLATAATGGATPGDLVLAVDAASDAEAEAALASARALLDERQRANESSGQLRPRTLDSALRQMPDANLAAISVPGEYAKLEAMTALRRGLHVFLFSDNVSVEDEIELKRLALERDRLCMGPDCGTAYIDGVGLGFANVVPRGRVGCVAASGTGLQAVVSHLAALGEGISHGIGVGGRDLGAEVSGMMALAALDALASDASTSAVVIISKPPAPEVLPKLEAAIRAVQKPVIVCALGAAERSGAGPRGGAVAGSGSAGTWVATLEDAAEAVVAALRDQTWAPRVFSDPARVRSRLAALAPPVRGARGGLLGLFTGGTLAYEARLILEPLIGPVAANVGSPAVVLPDTTRGVPTTPGVTVAPATSGSRSKAIAAGAVGSNVAARGSGALAAETGAAGNAHRILDLGADEFTRGRPHPMIDVTARDDRVREAGTSRDVGVLLLDLVLGRAAHPDPARSLATAIRDARAAAERDGRSLAVIASVIGTERDPQGLADQVAALEAAGVEVLPSSAQAARFAALVIEPRLAAQLLGR